MPICAGFGPSHGGPPRSSGRSCGRRPRGPSGRPPARGCRAVGPGDVGCRDRGTDHMPRAASPRGETRPGEPSVRFPRGESSTHRETPPPCGPVFQGKLTSVGVATFGPAVGWPAWPWSFSPQQWTVPGETTAQVDAKPAARSVTFCRPTVNGEVNCDEPVVPSPICPSPFQPQHVTFPDCSSAQVWPRPARTFATPVIPGTGEGVGVKGTGPDIGKPSCPYGLNPQHHRLVSAKMAQAWN